jgi:hypothetical protein
MNWNGIISLLIFSIELILLANVLYFSRNNKSVRNGVIVLALLAGYQMMEFIICGLEIKSPAAVYIAFLFISFLPPVGLLFVLDLLKKRFPYDGIILLPAAAMMVYYLFVIPRFEAAECSVFYAVYNYPLGDIYGMFYYLPLAVIIILLFSGLKTEELPQKKNIKLLLAGYITAAIPVITAFILHYNGNSDLLDKIESVMCKFALAVALAYAWVIINISRDTGERSNS